MRTWRRIAAAVAAAGLLAPCGMGSEWPSSEHGERGRWRIGVGASVIGPVRSSLGVNGAAMRQLSGFGTSLVRGAAARGGGRSRAEAYAAGSGAADPDGVMRFDGGAWYDPRDSASANDPDWSWNWRLHDPTGPDPAGLKGFTEYTAYDEVRETAVVSDGGGEGWSSDGSGWFPGLRVEVACELWRSNREDDGCVELADERPWGVDLVFAFAYYFQRGLWKAGGEAASAEVEGSRESGTLEWWNDSYDTAQYGLDYDRDSQFHGGMWGAGTFGGPGFELATPEWRVRDAAAGSSSWSSSHSLRYRGSGDYREYSFEIIARPWWEPYEWLRVFGSVGLEISRREFEWSLNAWGTDGSRYGESGDAADWRVLGLVGGGASVQWRGLTLAGEALWRLGGDGLGVDGRTVSGEVEHGDWGFRLSLSFEF